MARGGGNSWQRMGRLNGSDAGAMAKPVWLCSNCRCWHEDYDRRGKLLKPTWCKFCSRPDFDHFDSSGEAKCWTALHLRVKAGEIRNLRRQVPFDLKTVDKDDYIVVWAKAYMDFVFEEADGDEWPEIVADFKPAAGMSPYAELKIRCLEAQGVTVRIITENGEV